MASARSNEVLRGAAGPTPHCWVETVRQLTAAHTHSAQRAAIIGLKAAMCGWSAS